MVSKQKRELHINSAKNIKEVNTLLCEFNELVSRQEANRVKQITRFLIDFQSLPKKLTTKSHFNIFDVTGMYSNEVKHSNTLAWLLNPKEKHGFGVLFLQLFLKASKVSKISDEYLNDCYVQTEFRGNESTIDILIVKKGQFLIYIENKTFSCEGVDQINREYRDMKRVAESNRIPDTMQFPIFLTPKGYRPISGDSEPWITVSYDKLVQEFRTAIPKLHDPKITFLIEDLIEQYKYWSDNEY